MPLPDVVFSVTEFLEVVNQNFAVFGRIRIQAEVVSVSHRGQTVFFTIADKQGTARLDCLIWSSKYRSLGFDLEPGMEVCVRGQLQVYKPSGRLSFIADTISPLGEGALQKAFEALKAKLQHEGLFAPERKRILPSYIERVGVITSREGEALRDFLRHLGSFGFKVQLCDARVEGAQAVDSVVAAIQWFSAQAKPVDVVVVTRGGGSLQSLEAFNSEAVARAIARSRVPVVAAIGHERDVTIADLVADVRASTPTDAARIVSEDWRAAQQEVVLRSQSWLNAYQRMLSINKQRIDRAGSVVLMQSERWQRVVAKQQEVMQVLAERWMQRWQRQQQEVNQCMQIWQTTWQRRSQWCRQEIIHHDHILALVDPKARLRQGYSIVTGAGGMLVRSITQLHEAQQVQVQVGDGSFTSVVHSPIKNDATKNAVPN